MGKQAYRGELQWKRSLTQAILLPEKKNEVVMRYEALKTCLLMRRVFWDVTPCQWVRFAVFRIAVPLPSKLSSLG